MGKTRVQQDRANELRRIEKSKRRQAYFVSDYIQAKYFHLYSEATNFFNALDILYPTKIDLRKTAEFRNWRTAIVTYQGNNKSKQQSYETIYTIGLQNQQYECQSPESHQPQSPESHQPQSPESHQPQSPESHQPQSPESHQPQSPESHQPQSPESHQPQSPESHRWKDNMEKDNMNYKQQTATVTTKTLEIVTEETIEQSDIQYDAVNDLTDARIDEIIEQLRQDPELNDIFNELDFDEGIDIDNDIYDIRFENELLTW